jgi:Endonuclease/Exonuclease/phosphatase family.
MSKKSKNNIGEKYGYTKKYLNNSCTNFSLSIKKKYSDSDLIPTKLSILTYNIWGIFKHTKKEKGYKFLKKIIKTRMLLIYNEINKYKPDIVCIQEMTNIALKYLKLAGIDKLFKYQFEENFDSSILEKNRNKCAEVFVFSNFKPQKIKIYSIEGNQGYNTSLMTIEFANLIIFNCYLQAGSKYSPGQCDLWYHYSRCRSEQISVISKLINKNKYKSKACLFVGDFNFDLNGTSKDWPELKELKKLDFIDSWKIINADSGYTEDTDINQMRWNYKFIHKKLRYDGILFKNIYPVSIKLIGTEPFILNYKNSNMFKKYFINNSNDKNRYYDEKNKLFAIWPSDHFGVLGYFEH